MYTVLLLYSNLFYFISPSSCSNVGKLHILDMYCTELVLFIRRLMFSSLTTDSKSKPSTSKSSRTDVSLDTLAAKLHEGYALTDAFYLFFLSINFRLYLILYTYRISPFPSYEVCQYVLALVLLVVERS